MAVYFDWDEIEDNVDEEFDENGNSIAEYTTEPDFHGNVISQLRGGVTSTLHTDGLGSTLAPGQLHLNHRISDAYST